MKKEASRLEALIARAGPFDREPTHEQRTSAWVALRMLASKRLVLLSEEALETMLSEAREEGVRSAGGVGSDFDRGLAKAREIADQILAGEIERLEALAASIRREKGRSYTLMSARRDGQCGVCRRDIAMGDPIAYQTAAPTLCSRCIVRFGLV